MGSNGHSSEKSRQPRWLRVGLVIAGIASAVSLAAMIITAVRMVGTGRGLETYRTFWLVQYNWVGLLVFIGCLTIALLVGLVLRWREHSRERRQWHELEAKHGNINRDA
jgi:hypothetical protein